VVLVAVADAGTIVGVVVRVVMAEVRGLGMAVGLDSTVVAVFGASMIAELVLSMELWRSWLGFGNWRDGSQTIVLWGFGSLVFGC